MKKYFLTFFCILFFAAPLLNAQTTTSIPDKNFEQALIDLKIDSGDIDGFVLTANINSISSLNISNKKIDSLTGIKGFTNLKTLICSNNRLKELDISQNDLLESLSCSQNELNNLDVTKNLNLKTLLFSLNQIKQIDISNNPELSLLDCSGNQLSELLLYDKVTYTVYNPKLERLSCSNNQIGSLDVTKNEELIFLGISTNQIKGEFVINNNLKLESLFCASNQITKLDLTNNAYLTNIRASYNQLTILNLKNRFNDLMSTLDASENPDLFCIQIDNGFTPPANWIKDDWTYYSETTCTDIYTYVPDDKFEEQLILKGIDSGPLDNFVLTSKVNTEPTLEVSGKDIQDLTGIEDFLALTSLDCSDNDLTSLDLSANVNLTSLNCSNNILPTINIANNNALINLECSSQSPFVDPQDATNNYTFNRLNVNANITLETIDCSNNDLINLDLSTNILLTSVDCSLNQITSLNIVLNDKLTTLICNDNALRTLNVKNVTNAGTLTSLNSENNPELFCIEVDDVAFSQGNANWLEDDINYYNVSCGTYVPDNEFESYLESIGLGDMIDNNNFVSTALVNAFVGPLDISNRSISDLTGIQDFLVLQNLNCSNNALTHLDLSNNTALTAINCSFNQIENLNVVSNTALEKLECDENALLSLDVRNTTNNGLLTTFNASNNPNLFCINVDDVNYSKSAAGWQVDSPNYYNIDCDNSRFTDIPDNNFEQALVDLGIDTLPNDNRVLTSNIEHLLTLNVSGKQIESLMGIKGFASLKELDCSSNYLNDLDVSDMINLEVLYCSSNYFQTNADIPVTNGLLKTNGTTELRILFCSNNNLKDLDVSGFSNLEVLNCSNNKLTNLDISNNTILKDLNCNSNQISNLTGYTLDNSTLQILSCSNNEISTLSVEKYLAIKTLYCRSNALSQLYLNTNIALEVLDFGSNLISDIDLADNTKLISVSGTNNNLTEIDLNTNVYTFLETLNISNNQISILTLNSPNLKYLFCSTNQLTSLDLTTNGSLITLNVSSNSLSNLTLSSNLNQLKTFNCSNNSLVGGFDLSTMGTGVCPSENPNNSNDFCPDSISINVSNNQLDFINIQNGINSEISSFNATTNPSLSCIQIDDVNNIASNWLKDANTAYSLDCRFGETYVPDEAFEQALRDLGYDLNKTDPLDNYVPTVLIEGLLNLDIIGKGITDLTGIGDFTALQDLNCSNNDLNVIDLKKNLNLIEIDCSNNTFSDLDFSNNVALTIINCSSNALSNLELTANFNLTNLNISNNSFSEFDSSNIPYLEVFNCDYNLLLELDFQTNTALTSLNCQSNVLEKLNVRNGQNQNLVNFNAQGNSDLTCIETDIGAIPGGVTWLKDATAEFAINCYYGQTNVPDDAFELALMALGLDNVLDDYVVTANIKNISFLNISNNTIGDLTGLEDFVSLKNLNFSNNDLVGVDLSENVLLEELDASNNVLTEIDLSFNPNLEVLNISTNSLSEVDLNANTNLFELNVSSNQLTVLNVDVLVDLQFLDCSSNRLESLSVELNPQLVNLYCQTNSFVSDQLNLQNGANPSLINFNATDNGGLQCILVDDPFVVITNASGVYDNWLKDSVSNYQSVCIDADNDGIANEDDVCPGTPFGIDVDLFGCPYLVLPNDNFTVLITGETCLNNNDGKINIVTSEYYNYTITLKGVDFNKEYHFTNEIDILNLLAGSYEMCITIEEQPNYISCYDVVISQPEPLEVLTNKSVDGKSVSINMSGSSSYNVNFNGLKFNTSDSSLTLSLQDGENNIKIGTGIECQGVHEETILMSNTVFVYPNPFRDKLNLYIGNTDSISINIYSYLGQLIYSKTSNNQKSNKVDIDTSSFGKGLYIISVQTESLFSTFKIVKK